MKKWTISYLIHLESEHEKIQSPVGFWVEFDRINNKINNFCQTSVESRVPSLLCFINIRQEKAIQLIWCVFNLWNLALRTTFHSQIWFFTISYNHKVHASAAVIKSYFESPIKLWESVLRVEAALYCVRTMALQYKKLPKSIIQTNSYSFMHC